MARQCSWVQILTFGMLALLAAVPPARADTLEIVRSTGTLNICANPEALPYTSGSAEPPGFQLELQREIARLRGWQATVTWAFNRAAAARLGCGGFMGRMVAANSLPAPDYLTTEPYMGSGFVIALPPGSRTNFGGLRDVLALEPIRAGKPIGITLGAWVETVIEREGAKTTPYIYQEQIVDAVLAGEVAAGVVARENAGWYLRRKPGAFAQYEIFRDDANFRWNVGMAMRKSDVALIGVLNAALAEVRASGTLDRIMAKYGLTYLPPFSGQ